MARVNPSLSAMRLGLSLPKATADARLAALIRPTGAAVVCAGRISRRRIRRNHPKYIHHAPQGGAERSSKNPHPP